LAVEKLGYGGVLNPRAAAVGEFSREVNRD
jgi:hypothetical protein